MVATMETDNVVDIVTGKRRQVRIGDITPEAWLQIIHSAVDRIDMKTLKGLRMITHILPHEPVSTGVSRTVDSTLPRIWVGYPGGSEEIEHSRVFVECAVHSNFPQSWSDAPKNQDGAAEKLRAEYLLLSRNKKFYVLKTAWIPQVDWDDNSMSSTPRSFSYHISSDTKTDLIIREATDDILLSWFAKGKHDQVHVLQSLWRACRETSGHFKGVSDSVRSQQDVIQGYLDRLTNL
jgi:hypothetical protein